MMMKITKIIFYLDNRKNEILNLIYDRSYSFTFFSHIYRDRIRKNSSEISSKKKKKIIRLIKHPLDFFIR